MEGRLRKRYQLILAVAVMLMLPASASAHPAEPGSCGGSFFTQNQATHVWTDQGTGSAYVASQAACGSGPSPAAAHASSDCVLWNLALAEQQFGSL